MSEEPSAYRVVAFLQNCWFRPGTSHRAIDLYLTDQSYRRKVLAMSMSGRRLARAFGERFPDIWWDNASQYVADYSAGASIADPIHMMAVIGQIRPVSIICFGKIALHGMQQIRNPDCHTVPCNYFPHPNARGLTQFQLNQFASEIISRYF